MYTYLIVDDEPLIRKGTIKKLQPLSQQITCYAEASNGQEAITLIREHLPDFIILDMQMPVMDGMQLLPWLSKNYPDIPLIVISGYQNFDYMKQAIAAKTVDYILKPFSREEIQKTVLAVLDCLSNRLQQQQTISLAREEKEEACYTLELHSLENFLLGYKTDFPEIRSKKLSYINRFSQFVLFTFYYYSEKQTQQLSDWIHTSYYQGVTLLLPGQQLPQMAFLLLFFPDIAEHHLQTNHFFAQLQPFLQFQENPLLIGVSQPHKSLSSLNVAFQETKNALNSLSICATPYTCSFSSPSLSSSEIVWEKEDEFLFRIESGMTDTVATLAHEFFDFCRTIPDLSLLQVKHYCNRLYALCTVMLNRYLHNYESSSHVPISVQAITDTLFTLDELEKYYCQFFTNLAYMIKPQSIYANANLIEQICIYIQENYYKNLTQEYIASLFYLNRSYLSQLFRQKTGKKFIDFLNDVRIEKAKELLTTTDKKMYQISKSSGYDNTKYFFRIFKKKTGMSPQAWRDLNQ